MAQPIFAFAPEDRLDIKDVARLDQALGRAAGPAHAVERHGAGLSVGDNRAGLVTVRLQPDSDGGVADVERHRQDPRLDVAVSGNVGQRNAPILADIDGLERAMPAIRLVIAHEAVDQRLARHQLNFRVERRANAEAALIKLLLAVALRQFAPHFLGEEPRRDRIRRQHARIDHQRLGPSLVRLLGGDVAVLLHAPDDVVAPFHGAVMIAKRVQRTRLLRQSREIRDFGDGQLVHGLVEIIERRSGDAIVGKAEINLIEVELEDLFLRVGGFDSHTQQDLADLAVESSVRVQEEVLGHLLSDGRGALNVARALQENNPCAHDALGIDAPVACRSSCPRPI